VHRESGLAAFQSLLVDTIRNGDLSWRDAREALQTDPRWAGCEGLDDAGKEDTYNAFCMKVSRGGGREK